MNMHWRQLTLALAGAALLGLGGCGGSGGDGIPTPAAPSVTPEAPVVPVVSVVPVTTTTTTAVPVTVVDGAIGNARVCLDRNGNGVCDAGEPSGLTSAAGTVSLQVDNADVGKFPILAVVTTASVDADHGPVTVPFTLQAPADRTAVVSPLTTLVQTLIASSGASSADAEISVRNQTGINVSLFEDFTKGTSAESTSAGTVARAVVVVSQQQSSALASAVGSQAIDGTLITQAAIDKAIQQKLLEIIPNLLTALADPSVQSAATPAAREAALLSLANTLVAAPDTGIPPSAIATVVAVNNQTSTPTPTAPATEAPTSGGNLSRLAFGSTSNWFTRVNTSTAAQNTPDANGLLRYVERRSQNLGGGQANWNFGSSPARQSDLHFNGTAWTRCALNFENINTARDAKGVAGFNTCDNAETGTSKRASFDISGKTLASVFKDIRAAGYTNLSVGDNSASAIDSAMGSAVFSTGSQLFYQTSTTLTTAVSYYPGSSSFATGYSAAVAAGGLNTTACNSAEFQGNGSVITSLEALVAANPGTPCQSGTPGQFNYGGATYVSPDTANEAWGNSTVSIGTLGTAPVGTGAAPGFYTGNTRFRLAFKGGNAVTYYACKERFNTGSSRNCTAIGTGSYTISTLGDARVMTLNNTPSPLAALDFTRVFVERGGVVHHGYQNRPSTGNTARLNLRAANAVFAQLGLPGVNPDTPLALTRNSYAGEWALSESNRPTVTTVVSLFANGAFQCSAFDGGVITRSNFPCSLSFGSLATGAFTLVDTAGPTGNTRTGTFDFLNGTASGTYVETTPPASGNIAGERR